MSLVCANCQMVFSPRISDDATMCCYCNTEYQNHLLTQTCNGIEQFLKDKPLRDFAMRYGVREDLARSILDRKFEKLSVDDLYMAIEIFRKIRVGNAPMLIQECFRCIYAKSQKALDSIV